MKNTLGSRLSALGSRLSALGSRLSALGFVFALSGCAVKPVAITEEAHYLRATEDQRRLYDEQDPVTQALTLYDAIARALRYNMDYRVRLMEEASALGQTELSNYDLLPRLTAAAGYSTRNNDAFGYGYTPAGAISTTPSAASERSHHFNSLTFSWNVLDFGLSYIRAKQLADQSLIAEERRRKAQQNLVQDVRNAWWRAEAAQRLLPEIDALLSEVDQAAARAKLIETRKLLPPLQIVAYKRSLLDLEQQISLRRQELAQAKLELAQLLNLRPGLDYTVSTPMLDDVSPPKLIANIQVLEQIAVQNRPELREEAYRARVTELEGDKQLLSLLPSLSMEIGTNYDSNKYLVNQRWASSGLNFSWNLFKLFSLPSLSQANEAAARVDETRRLAVTSAVLAQTRMAAVRYDMLTHEHNIWNDAVNDDNRIVGYLNASKQVGLETELELIRAKARRMISKINHDLVYANLQGAINRLYNSIGIDTLPLEVENHDPAPLARTLEQTVSTWETASFAPRAPATQIPVAIIPLQGQPKEQSDAFTIALHRILKLSKIVTVGRGQTAPYRVETSLKIQPASVSGQPVQIGFKLLDESGKILAEGAQNSMLVTPIGLEQWRALGEGTGYRLITPIQQHLRKAAAQESGSLKAATSPPMDPAEIPSAETLRTNTSTIRTTTASEISNAIERGKKKAQTN